MSGSEPNQFLRCVPSEKDSGRPKTCGASGTAFSSRSLRGRSPAKQQHTRKCWRGLTLNAASRRSSPLLQQSCSAAGSPPSSSINSDISSHTSSASQGCEGHFNDRKFKENPSDLNAARQALTSYLQDAGSYKNAKSRKLLARILWLLSLDDAKGSIAMGFDDFKGETPVWYWITYIPQLLTGLGHKEAPRVYQILLSIAKSYP
ncbi:hypothetical protein MY4824_008712 [Beauveria thailandica]